MLLKWLTPGMDVMSSYNTWLSPSGIFSKIHKKFLLYSTQSIIPSTPSVAPTHPVRLNFPPSTFPRLEGPSVQGISWSGSCPVPSHQLQQG